MATPDRQVAPGAGPASTLVESLRTWAPTAQVRVPATTVTAPRRRVIDAHNHLGRWLSPTHDWVVPDVGVFVALMAECHVSHVVNLDGRWGDELDANLARYDRAFPERFSTFCHVDWALLTEPGATARLVDSLVASAAAGAKGLKVWKDLGLTVRDASGALVMPDDARLVPVWQAAGELGLPICIHTADPMAFFDPLDESNERIEELGAHGDWWFGDRSTYPSFDRLLDAMEGAIASAPGTRFMGAHVGCCAEDLGRVGAMLRRHPNLWVDLGQRLGEIGRQPRRFREFAVEYADRVVFGTDAYPATAAEYRLHYRFLETADEYFPYWSDGGAPPQGRWHISGVDLPDDVLTRIYDDNPRAFLGRPASD